MSATAEPSARMRFPDGLRAVAAMIVILPHCVGLFAYWPHPTLLTIGMIKLAGFGPNGVQIFFVLSGFVIAYTLRDQRLNARYVGNFILRRSIRLDPPYWTAILIFLALIALRRYAGHQQVEFPSYAKMLAHLFYLQDVLGYGDINIVFWTLCIEIQFYIVFCLLIWAAQTLMTAVAKAPLRWTWIFLLLFIASLAWPARIVHATLFPGSFFPHWYAFLLGAIVWWTAGKSLPNWAGYAAVGMLWIVVAARFDIRTLAVALTASSLLVAASSGNLYRWLNVPPFQFLGKLSYCIYLVHVPIANALLATLVRIAPRHEVVSYCLFAILLLSTIAAAYMMHRLVEVPSLRLSRRLKSKEADRPGQPPTSAVDSAETAVPAT